MSRIARIELFHVAIPLKKPFYPSWIPGYPQTECRLTLLKLTTDDGTVGWSAGNAFENEREGLGSLLGPYLIGMDPTDIGRVRQLLREASFLGWKGPRIPLRPVEPRATDEDGPTSTSRPAVVGVPCWEC